MKNDYKEIQGIEINGYSNHLVLIDFLFNKRKIENVFEYGCGFGSTPYFCKMAKDVVCVEMQYEDWFWKVRNDLKSKYSNLEIHFSLGGHNWDYAKKTNQKYDLIFADGHGDSRPDCINLGFEMNVPYIISHDTEEKGYKWERVMMPNDYQSFTLKMFNNHTSIWTNDKSLIEDLKNNFNSFYE
jgi:hypothetical protein